MYAALAFESHSRHLALHTPTWICRAKDSVSGPQKYVDWGFLGDLVVSSKFVPKAPKGKTLCLLLISPKTGQSEGVAATGSSPRM